MAFQQAKRYAEALPEWPPFLIICDVGYCFDVYADFSGTGKNYSPFPDPVSFRIPLQELTREDKQKFLKAIWLEPQSLDPSKISARVTRELANRLAKLARSLEHGTATEDADHRAHQVAQFLMRCLFTMFAEDVELIPKRAFLGLLESLRETPEQFAPMLEALWQNMDKGGFSPILRTKLRQFNGGLFADCSAIPLNRDQLELLIEAATANWAEVEPAIFGTLLERALDPRERHKLGAHYTPRAYVERLVMPTVIEPLREEWDNVYATAVALDIPTEAIERGIASLVAVPGRFQVVSTPGDDVTVVVDYAHTDDALRNLLETARPLAAKRLVTVFGCGGDRDRSKRPLMGMVAARLSDVVVITSDNPRSEDPRRIIEEIERGIPAGSQSSRAPSVVAVVDRAEAIERAVATANSGDVVLIAGKGHEKYQQIGDRVLPFDDGATARASLARRRQRQTKAG